MQTSLLSSIGTTARISKNNSYKGFRSQDGAFGTSPLLTHCALWLLSRILELRSLTLARYRLVSRHRTHRMAILQNAVRNVKIKRLGSQHALITAVSVVSVYSR